MYKNIELETKLRVSEQQRMELKIHETYFENAGMHPKIRKILQSFRKRARSKMWCVSTGHVSRSEYAESMFQLGPYTPADFGLSGLVIEQRYGRLIDPDLQDIIRHEINEIAYSQKTRIQWASNFAFQLCSWSEYAIAFQHCVDNKILLPSGVTVQDFDQGFDMLQDVYKTLTPNSRRNIRKKIHGISI
jgi:hypothetical protein